MRLVVVGLALVTTAAKLTVASRSFGTNDVHYWTGFARGAREFGPIGMYGHHFFARYNHPPLTGWMLVALNWLTDLGLDFTFLIRVPACLADVGTAVVLFELVRSVRSVRSAAVAAALVIVSPLLFIVSGFHGNTDPVFVFFSLLTLYLVGVRGRFLSGGVALGLAVSIKLVPIVLAPVLLVVLVKRGVRPLVRFAAGGLLVFLVLWVPVLVFQGQAFANKVLGYSGIRYTEWGWPELLQWTGVDGAAYTAIVSHAAAPALAISALAPAVLVWRRPTAWMPASGLALSTFLLLSPAFGMQYLVWPLAAAYLIGTTVGTVYNAFASALAWVVYSDWSGGGWWGWVEAHGARFTQAELALMVPTWCALLAVVWVGCRGAATGPPQEALYDRPSLAPHEPGGLLENSGRHAHG